MKHLFCFACLFMLAFHSCSKKADVVKTFNGNLPITATNTSAIVTTGQNIVSNIRCELSSISGTVLFRGFEIKETAPRQYNLQAKALYENWNTQISLPVVWTLDTTLSIKATVPGRYVLNFYNSAQLVKSDTVQAN